MIDNWPEVTLAVPAEIRHEVLWPTHAAMLKRLENGVRKTGSIPTAS